MKGKKMAHQKLKVLAGIVLALFLIAPDLLAYPILGTVDPGFASGYSLSSSTSGTATYSFKNLTGAPLINLTQISLQFEDDVFDNITVVSGSQPAGWNVSVSPFGPHYNMLNIQDPSNLGIAPGGTLSFEVKFALLDNALALDAAGAWDEGGYWEQQWWGSSNGQPIAGGSTAPIPEPATMLLFGISLLTVAGYGRYRLNRE